jgi:hypothetical protein
MLLVGRLRYRVAVTVRASDADRERVVAALQEHTAAGRLTLDEFTERATTVYAARTLDELAATTADLPRTEPQINGRPLVWAFGLALVALLTWAALYTLLGH